MADWHAIIVILMHEAGTITEHGQFLSGIDSVLFKNDKLIVAIICKTFYCRTEFKHCVLAVTFVTWRRGDFDGGVDFLPTSILLRRSWLLGISSEKSMNSSTCIFLTTETGIGAIPSPKINGLGVSGFGVVLWDGVAVRLRPILIVGWDDVPALSAESSGIVLSTARCK